LNKLHRKFEQEIKSQIESNIETYFDLINWEYEQDLTSNGLIKSLSDITRVDSFSISFVTSDAENSGSEVTAKYYEIIRPDTVDISFMYE